MIRIVVVAVLFGAAMCLSACEWPMRVDKVDEVHMVDPAGNIVTETTWRYADGETVVTTSIVDKQGNEVRRGYPPRRTTFVDF